MSALIEDPVVVSITTARPRRADIANTHVNFT
jgi:hypothetical protein